MKKPNKQQGILTWLKRYGYITQSRGVSHFKVYNLASIIYHLKKKGFVFEADKKHGETRYHLLGVVCSTCKNSTVGTGKLFESDFDLPFGEIVPCHDCKGKGYKEV